MTAVESTPQTVPSAPAPAAARAPVDFLIPTFNERMNLPHALASISSWASRVFVLDSGSTDGTQEIARELGAEVVEHAWEGYARQKNWALANLPFESPWVFILDADEAITPELRDEIIALISRPPEQVPQAAFYINRYFVFMGKRIRHCGYFSSWNLRLFKRGMARYEERPVHEHMLADGPTGYLRGLMIHDDRRGLGSYIAKHNQYSTLEAQTIFHRQQHGRGKLWASVFGGAIQRKRYMREHIYPRLPAKGLLRFLYMYILRLGFLDGLTGLRFCLFISSYELFISLKLAELRRLGRESDGEDERRMAWPGDTPAPVGREPEPLFPSARSISAWTVREKIARVAWMFVQATLFRWSFHNWYAWRRMLLRLFGARIGRFCRIRPTARVEIPWNLRMSEECVVGDHAILYSLGKITLGKRVSISQYAHLCAGTHDYTMDAMPLLKPPITVDDDVWIAADAFIGPGVRVGARSVVAARSTVVKDIPPDQVVGGNPARFIKPRLLRG